MMKYTEIDILNYVDGRLDDQQTADFLAQLRNDPELASLVEAMQASQLPIQQAYDQEPIPAVPNALAAKVASLTTAAQSNSTDNSKETITNAFPRKTVFGLAASLICGLGIGVLVSQHYRWGDTPNFVATQEQQANADSASLHQRLVKRIADYQSLYVEDTVSNVSATGVEDAQRLLASLSVGNALKTGVPDFTEFGYTFARAQELGFEGETLVQLVYHKLGTAPLAFCYMPAASVQTRAIEVSQLHQLQVASWVSQAQHYVLLADESSKTLQQMHNSASSIF